MSLTNAGLEFLTQAIINDSPIPFDNANAHLGVGDSAAVFDVAQTDLQAETNKIRTGMRGSYPFRADNVLTFLSVYSTTQANFAWNEWGVFNAETGGTMLNRQVESLGTKTSADAWQLFVSLELLIGN